MRKVDKKYERKNNERPSLPHRYDDQQFVSRNERKTGRKTY